MTAPAEAVEPLQQAAAKCRTEGDIDGEVTALAQLGRLAWWRQDLPALIELATRVAELDQTGHPTARALATFGRALFSDLMGDDMAVLAQLDSIEAGLLDPGWEVLVSGLYASVRTDLGEPEATYEIMDRFAATADPVLRAVLDGLEISAWWTEGRVDDVIEKIPQVDAAVRPTGVKWFFYQGLSGAALAYSHVGDVATARRCLDEAAASAPPMPGDAPSVRIAVCTAAIQLAEGDEVAAAETLTQSIANHGLEQGIDRRMWRQNIPLSYVLVPEAREHWDSLALKGHLHVARELAAAVVALREGHGAARLRSLDVSNLGIVRSSLHVRFAAELAVALSEIGRSEGPALLDALGPPGRVAVRALATTPNQQAKHARSLLAAVPGPPPERSHLGVLGPLLLRRGDPPSPPVVTPDLRRKKVMALLAFLVGHRRTSRSAITAALWPDLDERSAANNLSVTLNHLLRILEPWRDSGEPSYLLRHDGQSVHLVTGEHLRIDVDEFDRHLTAASRAEADGTPSVALEHDLAAIELYRDDLHLDVPDADWFVLDREHYRTRFVGAAVRAGQLLLGRRDVDQAQVVAHRALAVDPWAEDAYAVLVGAALARGDRSAAHRMLEHCLAALAELDVEPSDATQQLRRRMQGVTA